jgi:hypothetical protein
MEHYCHHCGAYALLNEVTRWCQWCTGRWNAENRRT